MAMRLAERVILVTGGGSGIGRAIAIRAASEGAALVLVGRRAERLDDAARAATREGNAALAVVGDIALEATAERAVAQALTRFGRLDGLVHAAGDVVRGVPLAATTREQWDTTFDTHVRALHHLIRHAVPMLAARGGSVVTIASNLALIGIAGLAAYSAAKGAVTSLTRALAVELGPQAIRVNAICPGLVETPATRARGGFDANRDAYAARAPLRRIGQPEDVAAAAAFLLSDDSSWITGQSLIVDGGCTIT